MKRLTKTMATAVAISLVVPLLSATSANAAEGSLLLHYALDATSGTVAADSSGNGRNGTIVGGPVLGGSAGVVLDGVNDHIALPNNTLAGLDSITVSTQVLVRASQGTPYFIYGLGNSVSTAGVGSGYLFATGDFYRAGLSSSNWSTEQVANSGAPLTRDAWHTLTYTLDDATDTSTLYLDGVQVKQQTAVTIKPSAIGGGTTTANYIGRSVYGADKYLAGSVRDFRIYSTALSQAEVSALQPTDTERATRDAAQLTLGDTSAVTANLTLPRVGPNGSTISWASDAPAVVSTAGVVSRPAPSAGPATVNLTATIARGASSGTRTFSVVVVPLRSDQSDVEAAAAALSLVSLDDVRGNLTLPDGPSDVTTVWTSSNAAVVAPDGVVTRQATDQTVVLTARLTKGTASTTRDFTAVVRKATPTVEPEGYAFAYFTGNSIAGENIYFAASEGNNALDWNELNGGQPVITSTEGTKGLRDPFLIRSPEGDTFYLIATDLSIGSGTSWGDSVRTGSQYIEVWESHDLVNWSDQRHIKIAPDTAGNTWAPEAYYDDTIGAYVVFWASSLYAANDTGHTGSTYHRMMYATTRDFVTFTEPEIWQDQGVSRIDSTVIEEDDVYYRFTKDEGAAGTGCTDIIQESSSTLRATLPSWTIQDSCIGRDAGTSAVEGPTVFKANPNDVNGEKFYLFVDEYGGRGYIPLQTSDIANPDWKVASNFDLPASPRHGTVIPVSAAELELLGKTPEIAPAPVNDDGEILRYDFDNGSGTTVTDVSGNGQNGTAVGGATWLDGALRFDGTDDYVDLPDNLLAGVDDITIEADVWIDSAQAKPYFIYGLGNTLSGVGNGYLFTSGDAYRTSLATGNWSTEQNVAQGTNLVRGSWAHLTYTLQGTTATLYLDGLEVATAQVTTNPGDIGNGVTTANYLGRSNYDADNKFRGQFREFAIYNRALTAAEVRAASGYVTPVVTASVAGAAENAAGWRAGDATVALALNDGATAEIEYRLDGGVWAPYIAPVELTADGIHLIESRATEDGAVVDGTLATTTVRLDSVAPVTTLTLDPADGVGSATQPVHLTATATDTTSGVSAVQYRLGDGEWLTLPADGLTFDTIGASVVFYRAVDVAGNVEATRTVAVSIPNPDAGTDPDTDPGVDPGTGAGVDVPATLTLNSLSVTAGAKLTVTGAGFGAGEEIAFTLFSTPTYLGGIEADASGAFTTTLTVPSSTSPGQHTLRAVGAGSGEAAEASVTITATAEAAAATGPLAATGLGIEAPATLAALLLAAGLLILARRRRLVRDQQRSGLR